MSGECSAAEKSVEDILIDLMVEKVMSVVVQVIRIWTRGLKFAQFSKCSECDENGTIASVSFS
jgi:hypothetical protein